MVAFLLIWIIFLVVGAYFLKSELPYSSELFNNTILATGLLSAICTIILTCLLVSFVPLKAELVESIEVCDISRDDRYITYREVESEDSQVLTTLGKKRLSDSKCSVTFAPDGEESYIEVYCKTFKYEWLRWLSFWGDLGIKDKHYILYTDAETISELREEPSTSEALS